jgi:hypothetical protein
MNPKIIRELVATKKLEADPYMIEKPAFHSKGRTVLKYVAEALQLPKGSYEIRSNKGGHAVLGEVTLHSDRLYLQFREPINGGDVGILYRTCNGRKDYSGGRNNWMGYSKLLDFGAAVEVFRQLLPAGETVFSQAA